MFTINTPSSGELRTHRRKSPRRDHIPDSDESHVDAIKKINLKVEYAGGIGKHVATPLFPAGGAIIAV